MWIRYSSLCFLRFELKVAIDELRFQIYYLYGLLIFVLPPAITCGLIRIQTGTFGCFVPNCSRMDKLSILIWTPIAFTSFLLKKRHLVYKIYFSGSYPAWSPNCTWMDTVSASYFSNWSTATFDNAFIIVDAQLIYFRKALDNLLYWDFIFRHRKHILDCQIVLLIEVSL
jgi:hypothetical protein